MLYRTSLHVLVVFAIVLVSLGLMFESDVFVDLDVKCNRFKYNLLQQRA